MSKINKICSTLLCFFLLLTTIITVIDFCCFDKKFYHNEYAKLHTAKDIGVSDKSLDIMTDTLLDYLKDDINSLDLKLEVNNIKREIFDTREKLHMVDVKDLYQKAIAVRNISLVFALCSLVVLIFNNKFSYLKQGYIKALSFFGFIFAFIGLFCLIDFNSFWTNFHKIFFTKNDYWLLDPRTELLIQMVPSQFFFDLCIRIIAIIVFMLILYYFLFNFIDKKVRDND